MCWPSTCSYLFYGSPSAFSTYLANILDTNAHFTLGVKANVQLKPSIPSGAKVEISPKGFKLGEKAWNRKNIFNLPKVINKCWTLWLQGWKKDTISFGKPICNARHYIPPLSSITLCSQTPWPATRVAIWPLRGSNSLSTVERCWTPFQAFVVDCNRFFVCKTLPCFMQHSTRA